MNQVVLPFGPADELKTLVDEINKARLTGKRRVVSISHAAVNLDPGNDAMMQYTAVVVFDEG